MGGHTPDKVMLELGWAVCMELMAKAWWRGGGGGRWRGASRKQESAKSVWVEREGQVPKGASETQAGGVGENRGVTWFNFT